MVKKISTISLAMFLLLGHFFVFSKNHAMNFFCCPSPDEPSPSEPSSTDGVVDVVGGDKELQEYVFDLSIVEKCHFPRMIKRLEELLKKFSSDMEGDISVEFDVSRRVEEVINCFEALGNAISEFGNNLEFFGEKKSFDDMSSEILDTVMSLAEYLEKDLLKKSTRDEFTEEVKKKLGEVKSFVLEMGLTPEADSCGDASQKANCGGGPPWKVIPFKRFVKLPEDGSPEDTFNDLVTKNRMLCEYLKSYDGLYRGNVLNLIKLIKKRDSILVQLLRFTGGESLIRETLELCKDVFGENPFEYLNKVVV